MLVLLLQPSGLLSKLTKVPFQLTHIIAWPVVQIGFIKRLRFVLIIVINLTTIILVLQHDLRLWSPELIPLGLAGYC